MSTRRERVVLELESNVPDVTARDAAAIELLNQRVNSLSKDAVTSRKASRDIASGTTEIGRSAQRAESQIDKLSGRIRIWTDLLAILGPGLVPIAAVGIPAVTGLASALGFAALGAGVFVGAFQGVGDALDAVNKARLEPTAENLEAARDAMAAISPEAQAFVLQLRSMIPQLKALRDAGAEEMFPGLTAGLDALEARLPALERIMGAVGGELGDIAESTGDSLASARWDDFFTFLETEAPAALSQMAKAAGNTGHAAAEMWMNLNPVNTDFLSWLVDATGRLDDFATNLDSSQGLAEFLAYVDEVGPQVGETLGAIANAGLQIVEATAPLGGPVLEGLEAVANVIGDIADSDFGTPLFAGLGALALYNRTLAVTGKLTQTAYGARAKANVTGFADSLLHVTSAQERASRSVLAANVAQRERMATFAKGAGTLALLGVAATGTADKVGLTNTAMLALAGSMAGPWGAAAGAGAGFMLDMTAASSGFADELDQVNLALRQNNVEVARNHLVKLKAMEADINKASGLKDFFEDIMQSNGTSLLGLLPGAEITSDAAQKATKNYKDFQKTAAEKKWVTDSRGGLHKVAEGFGVTELAARKAAAAIRTNRKAANEVAHQFVGLGDSLDDSKVSLDGWIHDMEESARALANFASNAVKAAKRGLRDGLIRELQAAGPAGALRMKQLADGTSAQISRANKAWVAGRRAIRDYTDAVGGVPSAKTTKIIENGALPARVRIKAMREEIRLLRDRSVKMDQHGAEIARGKIAALRDAINALRNRSVTITTNQVTNIIRRRAGAQRVPSAYGNIFRAIPESPEVRRYAQGDVANRHQAELAGPGPTRVWREPETQGEAYIPLANDDRRPRARAIAEETVAILGGDIEWYATGGRRGGTGASSTRTSSLRKRLHELEDAVHDSTAAIKRERKARDDLASKRDELKGNVAGKFRTDLFGESDVWAPGGGAGNAIGVLQGDVAKAKAFQKVLKSLRQQGLNGDALAEIAATGDIGQAQALLSMGKSDIRRYETLYDQRTRASNQVGAYAGKAAFGTSAAATKELRQHTRELKRMNHELAHLRKELSHHPSKTGSAVGKAIDGVAGKSRRQRR